MYKKLSIVVLGLACLSLTGCATIVNGRTQTLTVRTAPISNARCDLENNHGHWYLPHTPGSVSVNRSFSDLSVNCVKGRHTGHKSIQSHTKGMVFGNVLFGGVVGAGVDVASGAAYDYPNEIFIPLN